MSYGKEIIKKVIESYKRELLKFGGTEKIVIFGYPDKAFTVEDIINEIEKNPNSQLAKMFIRSRLEFMEYKGEI
jgi:hypothetical protein